MTAAFRPVHELAAEIAARRLSSVDLVDEYLARIERLEPTLHAFVSVNATHARLAAEGADKAIRAGHAVGPLHGIPIAVKDLVEIEGEVIAFGATFAYRPRDCYGGIAEASLYVARSARGHGAGRLAMYALIEAAERAGFSPVSRARSLEERA